MPDEEPGDVFLRHRSVVLAALLPGSSGSKPAPEQQVPEAVPSGSAAPPPDAADRELSEAETVPEPRRSTGAGSPAAVRPRSARRSSASEQINALLNGSGPIEPRAQDFPDPVRVPPERRDTAAPPKRPAEPVGKDRFDDLLRPAAGGRLGALTQRIAPQLRKPKVLLSVGAVLAVLLLVVLITTGGEQQSGQPLVVTSAAPTPAPAPAEPTEEVSRGKPIEVASATSHCPPGSTDGMDAFSGEAGKAWSCVRAYRVDGQVLTIDLGGTYLVESISIVPGWDHIRADGVDEWARHRTASRVSYQFDNENFTTYTQETLDQRGVVTTEIDPPVRASEVVLTILESSGDRSLNDTAVSSIVITGKKQG
ncbi:discoidin domain-containing protein [Nocardia sp. CC227C]|uniref:discoidin domain-containing protein n=1 Tax=Nocardia sp. CC227C TaxID=3044562 RepID=UPI00278C270D|nr:discoidin domain-containing protein [Nocardia sp. CC227C]